MNHFDERELLETIDRYLLGRMSQEEEAEFEERIENDPELKREVEEARSFLQVMKQPTDEKLHEQLEQTKEIMQEIRQTTEVNYDQQGKKQENEAGGAKIHTMHPVLKRGMSAAAVLLLLLIPAYFMFFYQSSANKLFNQYYQPPTNELTDQPRGGSAENQELKAMMNAYENSEYKMALKQANEYFERNNAKTNQLIFYRGIMHLELDNHQKALQDFRAFKNQDDKYRDKALWYLALTHLALQEKDQARNLLLQLQERPPSRFTQKAEALLAEME